MSPHTDEQNKFEENREIGKRRCRIVGYLFILLCVILSCALLLFVYKGLI